MTIRKATVNDLQAVTDLEAICFPAAEAASKESFKWRLETYPSHFFVMEDENGKIISFVNGPITVEADLVDEMFSDPSYSKENGEWQMIFGVATHPDCQRRGYAGQLLKAMIEEARTDGRKGVVLTCKEAKIHYYATFGFKDEGLSSSNHGGVPWHQMRITF